MNSGVVVKTARTETKTLSRLESIEIKTRPKRYIIKEELTTQQKKNSQFKFAIQSNSNISFQQSVTTTLVRSPERDSGTNPQLILIDFAVTVDG